MKNRKSIITFLVILSLLVFLKPAQAQREGMLIDPNSIAPGMVFGEWHFSDSNFKEIADTLVDLFREYGFKDLSVQECGYHGLLLRVSMYHMIDSAAAFGVYSVLADSCAKMDTIAWFDCINDRNVKFAKGSYYVQISCPTRKPESMRPGVELESIMIKASKFRDFYPNKIFLTKSLVSELHNLKVIKGKLGLRKGFPAWRSRFKGIDNFYLQIMPTMSKEGPYIVSRVEFKKAADMEKFISNNRLFKWQDDKIYMLNDKGRTQKLLKESDTSCIYLDMVLEMPKPPPKPEIK